MWLKSAKLQISKSMSFKTNWEPNCSIKCFHSTVIVVKNIAQWIINIQGTISILSLPGYFNLFPLSEPFFPHKINIHKTMAVISISLLCWKSLFSESENFKWEERRPKQ